MPLFAPDLIETKRLLIRRLAEPDLPALMEVNGDPAVTQFLPYATWSTMDDAQAWYQRMEGIQATGLARQFVIVERDSSHAVGSCLLFRFDEGSARAELGYVLGRAHWGRGVMREALTALIDAGFGTMKLRRIEAEVNPLNTASTGLLQRLGFIREGLMRQRWVNKGQPTDVEAFGLLNHEWPAPG